MAVKEQKITDKYAIYNGDCVEVMRDLQDGAVGFSIYSPPFSDLYTYSSSEKDLSNCRDYPQFLEHYGYVVDQVSRLTQPGRLTAVHCTDIAIPGQKSGYRDFPGDIIRIHAERGFYFQGRIAIWKEPLRVFLRTRLQLLAHRSLVKDSASVAVANGDYLLLFKRRGRNQKPIKHPVGLDVYAGEREVPNGLWKYRGEKRQEKNRLSQWIWQQYASCFWDDIRIDRVLPYRKARESEEERHVCPLQLDVIERALTLWSAEGDVVLTPFMGVGSEVYCAVDMGRRAVGIELKSTYYRQAVKNIGSIGSRSRRKSGLNLELDNDVSGDVAKHCEYGGLACPDVEVVD